MRVWRISNHEDLSGRGGLLFAGRWNRLGTPIVYTADHPATAMLETLVHLEWDRVPETYKLIQIDLPDDSSSYRIDAADLPTAWRTDPNVTQAIGTDLFNRAEHLFIFIPSVLVPHAWNVLLNPLHADAGRCSITEVIESPFDARLIR